MAQKKVVTPVCDSPKPPRSISIRLQDLWHDLPDALIKGTFHWQYDLKQY